MGGRRQFRGTVLADLQLNRPPARLSRFGGLATSAPMSREALRAFWSSTLICRPRTGPTKPEASKLCFLVGLCPIFKRKLPNPTKTFPSEQPATIRGVFHPSPEVEGIQKSHALRGQTSLKSAQSTARSLLPWEGAHLLHCQRLAPKKGPVSTVVSRIKLK